MAVAIVELLELVDVDAQERQSLVVFASVRQLLIEPLVQIAMAVQPGQVVRDGILPGLTESFGGALQQRSEGLLDIAAQCFQSSQWSFSGHGRADQTDPLAVCVVDRRDGIDPNAVTVDVEDHAVERPTGQGLGEPQSTNDLLPARRPASGASSGSTMMT